MKLENRNWKFGLHAFVPLIKIVPDHSSEFLVSNFKFQAVNGYKQPIDLKRQQIVGVAVLNS